MLLRIVASLLAVGLASAAVSAAGDAPAAARESGDAGFAAGDFTSAALAYRSALDRNPRDGAAALGLARIALYRNDLDEADRDARAIDASDPAEPRARRLLANVTERRENGPDYRVDSHASEVDVPFTSADPLPQLEARVDGKVARLLLDTGGTGLDLSSAFAAAIGLASHAAGDGTFAGGRRGAVRIAHVDRLDLGGATVRSIPVSVLDAFPPGIDGVLGTNVLYRFLSTIDYPHDRLVLRPKETSVAFDAAARERGAIVVPMLLVPDHFIFAHARVGAAPDALFNIDTGGGGVGVQLTKTELDAAGIVPDAARATTFVGGGGGSRTLPFETTVTFGEQPFAKVAGLYFPDGDQYGIFPFSVAGTLSHELFKRGALTFDFASMNLIFEVRRAPSRASDSGADRSRAASVCGCGSTSA